MEEAVEGGGVERGWRSLLVNELTKKEGRGVTTRPVASPRKDRNVYKSIKM